MEVVTKKVRDIRTRKVCCTEFSSASQPLLWAAALIVSSGIAVAQSPVSDAQIEASVLKALAGAPALASQAITTRTIYGTVTLSGTVSTEALRRQAETLAANASGVKKVVDELTLGDPSVGATSQARATGATSGTSGSGANLVLQSDGTYAPADSSGPVGGGDMPMQPQRNDPENDQKLDSQMQQGQDQLQGRDSGKNVPQQPPYGAPPAAGGGASRSPMAGGYPAPTYPQGQYQGQYPQGRGTAYGAPMDGGQTAGLAVTVPAETLIRIRVNQRISSNQSQPGSNFDGIVVNDVVAGNFIAIPRGASVQGRVVAAKSSGALKGRGDLTLQLTQVTLAGRSYPIVSDNWEHHGGDKTLETVNKTAGFGAIGALFGAVAGGGVGAAVGGGIGAAAGLGSSAASGNGQVVIPSEAVVTFHLAQPAAVQTVSEQEMQRLAYGVPPGADQRYARRPVYPRPYYAPYPPYGYPY